MTEAVPPIDADLSPGLAEALAAEISEAGDPPERALVVDHVVQEMVSVVASDPTVSEDERGSVMPVLDAADEHCERMGAFTS